MLSLMTTFLPSVLSVLELFKGPLASLRFADVDAEGLATLASDVESAALEVATQEAKLAELRQGLVARQDALLVLAQRALAYARVYAENNDELLEELNRISLPRLAKVRKASASKGAGSAGVSSAEPASQESEESVQVAAVVEASESEVEVEAELAEPVETAPAASARKARKNGPLARERHRASDPTSVVPE